MGPAVERNRTEPAEPGVPALTAFAGTGALGADDFAEAIATRLSPHAFDIPGGARRFTGQMAVAPVGAMAAISTNYFGADTCTTVGLLDGYFAITRHDLGATLYRQGTDETVGDTEHGAVVNPGRPLVLKTTEQNIVSVLRVDATMLTDRLASMLGRPLHEPLRFEPSFERGNGFGRSLMRLSEHLFHELDYGGPLARSALALADFERHLMSMLLLGQPHNYSAALHAGPKHADPPVVRCVEDYIAAHADQPIGIDDLARAAGVSARTLHYAFRKHRDTTPMAFLRSVRLRGVRADLMEARPGTTVTEIALKWGFTHFSNFSRNYRRAFGETPSETLRR